MTALRWLGSGLLLATLSAPTGAQTRAADHLSATPSRASAPGLLSLPAQLELMDVSLDRALNELSFRSGALISFSPALLPLDRTFSCLCRDRTVGQALGQLLVGTGLRFTEIHNQVVIYPDRVPAPAERLDPAAEPAAQPPLARGELRPAPAADRPDPAAPSPGSAPIDTRITGKIVDRATGQPIAGARVQVIGTNRFAISGHEGTYQIRGLDPGSYALRIMAVGYGSEQRPRETVLGSTGLDWSLNAIPLTLAEIVTTATGEQLTRELGHSIGQVDAAAVVETAPVTTLTQVLSGRVAGVTVLTNDGVIGGGSRVRIRGVGSLSLSNDPLLYVDGIRVSERGPRFQLDNGGFAPSFFDDLNPEEIESIEIVKGPSAATLYGTQAANGIIRVTTKRGGSGPTRWTVYSEQGLFHDPSDYPSVYFAKAEGSNAQCLLPWEAAGQCRIDRVFRRDLMREPSYSPLQDALRQQYGAQLSGGSEAVRYFGSAEIEDQGGLFTLPAAEITFRREWLGGLPLQDGELDPSRQRKINLRANLSLTLGSRADLNLSAGYTNNDLRIPQVGDNGRSIIAAALSATADPTAATPYGYPVRPGYAAALLESRRSDHFINSVAARYRPASWLTVRATVGLDYIGFEDSELERNGWACPVCGQPLGFRMANRYVTARHSVDFGATAVAPLGARWRGKTSVGVQYNADDVAASLNSGKDLPFGAETYTGAAAKSGEESTTRTATLGSYLEQQVSLDERLFLTGAMRVDQNAAFGREARVAYYPKLSAAWTIRDGGAKGGLGQLRARAAYGQSGLEPGPVDAIPYYRGTSVSLFSGPTPGVSLGGVGNPALRPERSRELEAGLDAVFWDARLTIGVTGYDKRTTDALVRRPLAGSVGAVVSRMENLGTVSNRGLEVSVQARLVDASVLQWQVGLELSTNRNRLVALAPGTPSPTGFGYRQAVGYPLFGTWWPALTAFADADHDGIITGTEVVVTDSAVFNGSTLPTRTGTLSSTVGLFRNRVRLATQIEYKGGFRTLDVNALFSCGLGSRINCRGLNDPTASLDEQARSVAVISHLAFGAMVDDADYVRLREVSLAYTLPRPLTRALGAHGGTVTVTGRNLLLITGFRAWDPEGNALAGTSPDGPVYNFWQPGQPRSFLLRLNLIF